MTQTIEVVEKKLKAPWVFGTKEGKNRGVAVEGELQTAAQAIKSGGLDWLVELRDPQSADTDAIPAPGWKQVVRVDEDNDLGITDPALILKKYRTLGMVKSRYRVLQNEKAFGFFDKVTLDGAAIFRAVGHLNFGATVFLIAERPQTMELYAGEEIRENLILTTSHDGSSAVHVRFAPYRVSTGTMLSVGLGKKLVNEVKIRHTKSMEVKLETVENVLAAETNFFDRWRAALLGEQGKPGFAHQIVSKDDIEKVVRELFPAKNKKQADGSVKPVVSGKAEAARSKILDRVKEQAEARAAAQEDAGEKVVSGTTALDVFLGVSEYVAKDRRTRKEGNNWVVSTFGSGADLRQDAFDLISGL